MANLVRLTGALVLLLCICTRANSAILHTSQFLSGPEFFNGFEGMGSSPNYNPNNFLYSPTNTPYSEGGITVAYFGMAPNGGMVTNISFVNDRQGQFGWYGPGTGYTQIKLTNGKTFKEVQFLASSGFGDPGNLVFQLLNHGNLVSSGYSPIRTVHGDRTMTWYGFSGGDFDEVRLQAIPSGESMIFNCALPDICDALVIDSISAVQTPLPPAWGVMLTGVVSLVLMTRRRRSMVQ